MTKQPGLFDLEEGRARQTAGQVRSLSNADAADDQEAALRALQALAARHIRFCADDVWHWCQWHDCALPPATNLGAVFKLAVEQGLIRSLKNESVQSKRPAAQGRRIQVWIGV